MEIGKKWQETMNDVIESKTIIKELKLRIIELENENLVLRSKTKQLSLFNIEEPIGSNVIRNFNDTEFRREYSSIINNWDFDKFGVITAKKIHENFGLSLSTVGKAGTKFKKQIDGVNKVYTDKERVNVAKSIDINEDELSDNFKEFLKKLNN